MAPRGSDGRAHEPVTATSVSDLRTQPDFDRSLRAADTAPETIVIHREPRHRRVEFLLAAGVPTIAPPIRCERVEAHLENHLASITRRR
jgi:hypothetical protein